MMRKLLLVVNVLLLVVVVGVAVASRVTPLTTSGAHAGLVTQHYVVRGYYMQLRIDQRYLSRIESTLRWGKQAEPWPPFVLRDRGWKQLTKAPGYELHQHIGDLRQIPGHLRIVHLAWLWGPLSVYPAWALFRWILRGRAAQLNSPGFPVGEITKL